MRSRKSAMAQKLVVPITFKIYQGDALVRTETLTQPVIKIGRDQKAHLRLEDEGVSRMHAVIEAKPEEIQVIDLGSGTQVNGQSINKCSIKSGDEIKLGTSRLVIEVGEAVDAAEAAPAKPASIPPPAATPSPSIPPPAATFSAPVVSAPAPDLADLGASAPMDSHSHGHKQGHGAVEGEEIYQLIKRGEINPNEVEEAGVNAMEVSILWKNAILHVAHLRGNSFTLVAEQKKKEPASVALGVGLGVGLAVISAAAAKGNYAIGAVGTALAFAGAGVGIAFDRKNIEQSNDVSRFIVGPEMLQGTQQLPVVLFDAGMPRFVFAPGCTGEMEVEGVKQSLETLITSGQAQAYPGIPGANVLTVVKNGRYRMELGGLTVLAKVVAPGRRVVGGGKRDTTMLAAFLGSAVLIGGGITAMRVAIADDAGYLSQGNDEDRLRDLRAFIQRQQEREPPQEQPQNTTNTAEAGGTGTRHAGEEGKMGRRDAPNRNAHYTIQRRDDGPQRMAREEANRVVANRGVLALFNTGAAAASGGQGPTSPFGADSENGSDDASAQGNLTGDFGGESGGFGGLGMSGTGWGGGGTGEGTIGMGNIGTLGHGSGTGSGQGIGSGAGTHLANRRTQGPLVRAQPPDVSGLLSPEAIRRVVLRNLPQVTHCHEQGLAQNPNLEGRVVIRFVIGGEGQVMGANVAESSLAVPSVGNCIAQAVRRWNFPAPQGGGVVTVNYPFTLQHPEGG